MSNVSLLIFGSCLLSLLYGVYAIRAVLAAPTGTERMQQIALAIQEGASAYLARQYKTIAIVGANGDEAQANNDNLWYCALYPAMRFNNRGEVLLTCTQGRVMVNVGVMHTHNKWS